MSIFRRQLHSRDPLVYELAELRRQQFDNLIWQVPVLTLTGQAFLYAILLGGDTTPWARAAAGLLSIGISFLTLTLLARHRQTEQLVAEWLRNYEEDAGWPDEDRQHGSGWSEQRASILPGFDTSLRRGPHRRTGWGLVPLLPAYKSWVIAHWMLIALTIVVVVVGFLPWELLVSQPVLPEPTPATTK